MPGRTFAYFALFSEIGIVLLVTVLVGVLAGYWADQQLGTLPIFLLVGLFVGLAAGSPGGVPADQPVPGRRAKTDRTACGATRRAPRRGATVANEPEMETVATREPGDRGPPERRRVHPLVWLVLAVVVLDVLAFLVRPAVPQGRRARRRLRLSRSASSTAPSSSRRPTSSGTSTRPTRCRPGSW